MTRKSVRAMLGFLVAVFAVVGCTSSPAAHPGPPHARPSTATAADRDRPNFVFVLTDDLSWNLVSHMPHVLAMEQAGMALSHYYVVDSLCCPSRSAIFTGEYPHDDGVFTNAGADGGYFAFNQHGDQRKSFAVALHDAGYRTAMMGKYLNQYEPRYPVAPGWDEWDVTGLGGYGEFGYTLNQNGQRVPYGRAASDYLTDVLAGRASTFIDSAATSGHPFMLEVATFAPHDPYTPAPRYAHAAQQLSYPKTPAYGRKPANPPSWLKNHPPLSAADEATITTKFRKRVEDDLSVDDMIGRLENELRAKGLAKNTYVVFSSDNGFHMGEYTLISGKQTAFETDIRVPLIVTGPGVPAGQTAGQLASNIDLAPTFESLAGLPVRADVDGHSLAALWHGQDPADWRQAILVEHHGPDFSPDDPDRQTQAPGDPPSYEAVRTANALYVRYAGGAQEYYDTATDPYELDNLAGKGVPADLRDALSALENCHTGVTCWAAAHFGQPPAIKPVLGNQPPAIRPVLGNPFLRITARAGAVPAPNGPRASDGPG
jgi:N-acetylglucosamine-6-sulfatase